MESGVKEAREVAGTSLHGEMELQDEVYVTSKNQGCRRTNQIE